MTVLTLSALRLPLSAVSVREDPPKTDWPLMGDVTGVRAGVPDALIAWRRARAEAAPRPCDPDMLRNDQNSL